MDRSPHDRPWAAPPVELRSALVAGVAHHRKRTRARVLGTSVAAAALCLAAFAGGLLPQATSPALAALAIQPDGSWIEVRIVEAEAGEQQMTSELAQGGIDAQVRIIPTVPSKVGEWLGLQRVEGRAPARGAGGAAAAPPEVWDPDDIGANGGLLTIRRSALGRLETGRWVVYVGREPRSDETPQVLSADGPRLAR